MAKQRARQVIEPVQDFLRAETSGGGVLLLAAFVAMVWANGPGADVYERLWSMEFTLPFGPLSTTEDLRHWVNEGLMVVFFFVVGLEVKRELVTGELSDPRDAALPAMAAVGGVVLPASIFLVTVGTGAGLEGWGIPIATDIAFVVGVLALLGRRVPSGVKVFLLSVAIVDDVIAITVIAFFYSASIGWWWLFAAACGLVVVVGLRRLGVHAVWPYVLVGVAVWYVTHASGVHATIAGVALALLTPARPVGGRNVLDELEHRLHPVSAFLVIPLFALANAGVNLRGGALPDAAESRLAWAVAVGLLAGKLLGIGVTTIVATRAGLGRLPEGMRLSHIWGAAALAGIGFTVSLFIADLAFESSDLIAQAKVGILFGSVVSAVTGALLLATVRGGQGTNE